MPGRNSAECGGGGLSPPLVPSSVMPMISATIAVNATPAMSHTRRDDRRRSFGHPGPGPWGGCAGPGSCTPCGPDGPEPCPAPGTNGLACHQSVPGRPGGGYAARAPRAIGSKLLCGGVCPPACRVGGVYADGGTQ